MGSTPGFPITCLVPGPWSPGRAPTLTDGWTSEWVPNDGRFAEAFRASAVPPARRGELDRCPGALVIEGRIELPANPRPLQAMARSLVDAGALAVRVEQSKAGFLASDWADRLAAGDLFRTLVVLVVGQPGPYTCGMHLFGFPDAASDDPVDGARVVSSLCRYQIDESPVLLSGHTFRPDAESPRRTLERWPDDSFPHSHPCWNPFGVWRLLPSSERHAPRSVTHFMPSLAAQLAAAEHKLGRALDRVEVEALRDRAPRIAMEPAHARELERSRGYADVDPVLAWEHWQVLRRGLGRATT